MSVRWIKFDNSNFDIYGIDGSFHRLPEEFAKAISSGVAGNSKCPAGGRIRFSTDSANIYISRL